MSIKSFIQINLMKNYLFIVYWIYSLKFNAITDLDQEALRTHYSDSSKILVVSSSTRFYLLVSGGVLRDKFENIVEVQDLGLDYGSFRVSAIFKLFK